MERFEMNNGMQIPALGIGTWFMKGKLCIRTLMNALDMGYELIDTANMYNNGHEIGYAIRESRVRRDKLFVTTKISAPYDSYKGTIISINKSLREMNLDYLDLVLVHGPYENTIEIYEALEEAVKSGKIRSAGVSNFSSSQINSLRKQTELIPAVNQCECHVYNQQKGLRKNMNGDGVLLQAWAPFAQGKKHIFEDPILKKIALTHGKTTAQVILRYNTQIGIPTVVKSTNTKHLLENLHIFNFSLTDEELKQISDLDKNESIFTWF